MKSVDAPVWTSANGIALPDLVPARLRRAWQVHGLCPDRDLYTLFSEHVRTAPGRAAVIDAAGTLDYAALDARVRRAATALAVAGWGAADIIGVLLPNGRDAVVAELAIAAIGAVALPIPDTRGPRDVTRLLGRSRAGVLITAPHMIETIDALQTELPHLRESWTFGVAPPGARALDDVGARAVRDWRPARPDAGAPARILASSGSESEPKMVAYSHDAMAGGRGNYLAALRRGPEPIRALVLVSLASSYGSLGTSVILTRHGGTLVLQSRFDAAAALRAIERHRPTHVFGVPTMLRRMAECDDAVDVDPSSLRAVVSSAGPLHRHVWDACAHRFGLPPVNVYGASDGANCHTGRDPGRWGEGLAGVPDLDVAEISIRHADGRPLSPEQPGEIWALGPMTPLCHVAAPDLDARHRAPGGWVRTGDLGRVDAEGRLWVIDRIKRLVIRGGISMSPVEVEHELSAHPNVVDVYCVPVPDPDLGERMCACVAPRDLAAPPAPTALIAFLRERGLDRWQLPECFLVLPELPLGPTGKVCPTTLARIAAKSAVPVPRSPAST